MRTNKRPTNNNKMVFVNKRSLFINIKCYALVSVLSLPQYYSEQFYFNAVLCSVCLPMVKIILSKHKIAHSVLCTLHKMSIQLERRERARACRCTSRFYLIWKVEKKCGSTSKGVYKVVDLMNVDIRSLFLCKQRT